MHIVVHNVNKETITKHNNNQELTNKNYNKNIYNKKIQRKKPFLLVCQTLAVVWNITFFPYLELDETG